MPGATAKTRKVMTEPYSMKESLIERHLLRIKESLYKWLLKDALPLFLRGQDNISFTPHVFGYHEIRVKELINHSANNGYHDFLLDIGANIGLSACQSGNLFKEVHCYEPNPDCFSILKVNTRISLTKCRLYLNQFGLGAEKAEKVLYVPKGNWGGGFIRDENNFYEDEQLGSKDGYKEFDPNNYNLVPIIIEPAKEKLDALFRDLDNKKLTKGFIKIDVEGYEPLIVRSIAESLPDNFEVIILFECFTKQFNPNELLSHFNRRAIAYKLTRTPEKSMPKMKRIWRIISQFGYEYQLQEFDMRSSSTDIVFIVNKKDARLSSAPHKKSGESPTSLFSPRH
jgi:FkbM family methyltransferase